MRDATGVELSEYSNIAAAANETLLSRGISVNIKAIASQEQKDPPRVMYVYVREIIAK